MTTTERRIIVPAENYQRLNRLIEVRGETLDLDLLDQELARAQIVPADAVPPDVVTMNTRLLFEEVATGALREIELVYPEDSDWQRGRVSVLAPVGVALLGLSVGDAIDFPMPAGIRRLRVVSVLHQPEAAARPQPPAA